MAGTIYSARYRIGSGGTYTGITLSNTATQLPATIANYLYSNYGAAILGTIGTAWTVINQGLIINGGTISNPGGIVLPSGGEVVNGNSAVSGLGISSGAYPYYAYGRITETTQAVNIFGGVGTVVNDGVITSSAIGVTLANGGTIINGAPGATNATISGTSTIAGALGTIINYGTLGLGGTLASPGVDLLAGGLIVNASTGYITYLTEIDGAAGTVVNAGRLTDSVTLTAGGTIINGASGTTNATISGASTIAGSSGTIINYGTLGLGQTLSSPGIDLLAGGLIVNASAGYVSYLTEIDGAAGTVVNAGTLTNSVTLSAGGTIINQSGGTLLGGFYITGGTGTLSNAGTVSGIASFAANGIVTNTATLLGGQIGVDIGGSGTLTNGTAGASTGYINGALYGVVVNGTAGLITNYGTIASIGGQAAVLLQSGDTIFNQGLLLEQSGSVSAAAISLKSGGTLFNSATLMGEPFGAYAQASTVINTALISAQGYGGDSAVGVELNAALLVNTAQVLANWPQAVGAVLINSATLVNSGTLAAIAANTAGNLGNLVGVGAYILSGGTLINSGTVIGAVQDVNQFNAILNDGVLATGTLGVSINNSGTIIGNAGVVIARNQSTNVAGNYTNIDPKPNVTIVNSGLIEGTGGVGIQLGDGNNLLQWMPSGQLQGAVLGGSGNNTLGLMAGSGTLYGIGGIISNFNTINVYSGASWSLAGTIGTGVSLTNDGVFQAGTAGLRISAPLVADTGHTGTIAVSGTAETTLYGSVASSQLVQFSGYYGTLGLGNLASFAGTIAGFSSGDTLVLLGTTATSASYGNQALTISNGASVLSTIALAGTLTSFFAPNGFVAQADGAGNTDILVAPVTVEAPCFAAGTRLRTIAGDVNVEALTVGARMVTASGAVRPVAWLGRRWIDCQTHPQPTLILPIRIRAEAFGPGLPARDLMLSPDHAVLWRGGLIPARTLVNGMTVLQEAVAQIEYWHVELASHDVLLAEGLPAESYLDTGNRHQFDGAAVQTLHADFRPVAPLWVSGPDIAAARAHLLARAGALGYEPPAPFLHLQMDMDMSGRIVNAAAQFGEQHRFMLPASRRAAARVGRIISDMWVPAERDPASDDARRLGVCIGGIVIDGKSVPLDHAALRSGFYPIEQRGHERWRWTDGCGVLNLPGAAKVLELRIRDGGVRAERLNQKQANGR